jgi:O-acetyl-ADP-ribose deacetylase (regulator of RNase III)
LKVADELGAVSIAFPAISTGIYGYPLEPAADIALAATSNAVTTNVDEVLFVLFEPQALRVFEQAFERIQRRKG